VDVGVCVSEVVVVSSCPSLSRFLFRCLSLLSLSLSLSSLFPYFSLLLHHRLQLLLLHVRVYVYVL